MQHYARRVAEGSPVGGSARASVQVSLTAGVDAVVVAGGVVLPVVLGLDILIVGLIAPGCG